MIEILSSQAEQIEQMQNVYTPLPFKIHFIFCLIATAVYLVQYARKGSLHYLLVMFAVDATFVTQYCSSSIAISILFGVEVVLLTAAAVFSVRYNKKLKQEQNNRPAPPKDTADNELSDEDF